VIDLLVYPGSDGSFRLYEDDGLTYGYERGEFSTIEFRWDDAARTLTIGSRSGSYPGMLSERTFRVTLVGADSASEAAYNGSELTLMF